MARNTIYWRDEKKGMGAALKYLKIFISISGLVTVKRLRYRYAGFAGPAQVILIEDNIEIQIIEVGRTNPDG